MLPLENDCRALWRELKPYIPRGDYEIVAVDERVDGLWFYGAMEVETITHRSIPYPTYVSPETVEKERMDMQQDRFPHLFLVRGDKHIPRLQTVLSETGWRIELIPLKHKRRLLLCTPLDEAENFPK